MDKDRGMPSYPDKYFDLAIVDPQYGIGASNPSKKPESVLQRNGSRLYVESNVESAIVGKTVVSDSTPSQEIGKLRYWTGRSG